jgi:hypothetical protein
MTTFGRAFAHSLLKHKIVSVAAMNWTDYRKCYRRLLQRRRGYADCRKGYRRLLHRLSQTVCKAYRRLSQRLLQTAAKAQSLSQTVTVAQVMADCCKGAKLIADRDCCTGYGKLLQRRKACRRLSQSLSQTVAQVIADCCKGSRVIRNSLSVDSAPDRPRC